MHLTDMGKSFIGFLSVILINVLPNIVVLSTEKWITV